MPNPRYKPLAYLLLIVCAQPVVATETEAELLRRAIHELQAVEVLINDAEARADKGARKVFRYDQLRLDLATIRHSIENYLVTPRAQPRRIKPLSGDYRQ